MLPVSSHVIATFETSSFWFIISPFRRGGRAGVEKAAAGGAARRGFAWLEGKLLHSRGDMHPRRMRLPVGRYLEGVPPASPQGQFMTVVLGTKPCTAFSTCTALTVAQSIESVVQPTRNLGRVTNPQLISPLIAKSQTPL